MPTSPSEVEAQRRYYAETADRYDRLHLEEDAEHNLALSVMLGVLDHYGIRSILDVGAGTGRTVARVKQRRPDLRIVGVEPVPELREVAFARGISRDQIVDGDALQLDFADGEFDLVCEFGALHHIPTPGAAISEMLRVARRAVFISDCNNFGQGSLLARAVKQLLHGLGLWRLADLVKTRGRGYTVSEGDGIAYSYSVFGSYRQIRAHCGQVHLFNTLGEGPNLYRSASHVALLGIKN